jgi:hypothetical protein
MPAIPESKKDDDKLKKIAQRGRQMTKRSRAKSVPAPPAQPDQPEQLPVPELTSY